MFRKIERALSLRPSDTAVAVRAYRYLIASAWLIFIRRKSTRDVQDRIEAHNSSIPTFGGPPEFDYDRAALWINRVSRVPFPWARCYQRSVALSMWMQSKGLKPDLQFGARKTADGIDAHSWVEYDGRVINDSPNVRQIFGSFSRSISEQGSSQDGRTG